MPLADIRLENHKILHIIKISEFNEFCQKKNLDFMKKIFSAFF